MKIFKFMAIALVAMCGFASCSEDCDHKFIEVDYSKDIVGTWTCLEADFAQAFVFNADGTAITVGVENGEYWEDVQVNWKVENNKLILSHKENVTETLLELIPGNLLSITGDKRRIYQYCANDLSEEVVGMWVCNETPSAEENDMLIMNFNENGTSSFTGYFYGLDDFGANKETSYKVKGDLIIHKQPDIAVEYGFDQYTVMRMIYTPNATALGDVMSLKAYAKVGENSIETTTSWLRIKQSLALEGNKYDYIKTFVTNVSGEDKDIPFLNTSFNFAKMDGSIIDKFLKSTLFAVEFPSADTLRYSFLANGQNTPMSAPIEVEGNKMTIKMSANGAAYHDVELYAFQDQDNTQMHLYMPTASFEKFFANTSVFVMLGNGQLTENDTDAIANVYKNVADAVHSINLSLVMSKSK